MTIVLKPDQEKAIQEAIEAGLIRSVDEVTDMAIELLKRQQTEGSAARAHEVTSREEAVRHMQEFGDENRLSLGEPVTRNLLHEGHRL